MIQALYTAAQTFRVAVSSWGGDQDGGFATEYAVLIVLIALAVVAEVTALGLAISEMFTHGGDVVGRIG